MIVGDARTPTPHHPHHTPPASAAAARAVKTPRSRQRARPKRAIIITTLLKRPPPPIRSVRVRATRTHTNHFDPPLTAPQGRAVTGDRARVDLTLRGSELRPRTVLGQSIGASSLGEAPRESAEGAIPVWAARALRLKGPLGLPFGWFELLYLDEVKRVTVCRAGEMACCRS